MTDPTTTPAPAPTDPADPPVTQTPLLTPQGLTVCDKFSTDLADLCNAASQAGMTPNMLLGQFASMALMIGFGIKDDIDADAASPPAAPVPAPAPVEPPTNPAPVPSGPTILELDANGISQAPLPAGSDAILTLGAVTTPTAEGVLVSLALDPSAVPLTGPAAYSLELQYGAQNGVTYVANGLWPGVTVYGKSGDLLRLSISETNAVSASISQDSGVTWIAFFSYEAIAAGADPLYVHVTSTANAVAGNVTTG